MSNCCNAKVIDPSGEGIEGVCADCGEHCEVVSDSQFDETLDEILTHSLKRAYFNGSTDVKARESGVIPNDTKLGEVMVQVLVAEAKAAIQKLVAESIGEDGEVHGHIRPNGIPSVDLTESYHNQLRAEIRQRATERGLL